MTDLEKILFFRARILEGMTKKQASRELSKAIRLEKIYGFRDRRENVGEGRPRNHN